MTVASPVTFLPGALSYGESSIFFLLQSANQTRYVDRAISGSLPCPGDRSFMPVRQHERQRCSVFDLVGFGGIFRRRIENGGDDIEPLVTDLDGDAAIGGSLERLGFA